jgi:anti-sigma factor RsiW
VNPHVVERLSAYLDGEVPADERQAMAGHLRDCDTCARRLEEIAAVDAAVRELPAEPPAGYLDGFAASVRRRLERQSPRVRRLPVWTWAVAAALVLAVVTPLTLRRGPAPAESPARDEQAGRGTPAPDAAVTAPSAGGAPSTDGRFAEAKRRLEPPLPAPQAARPSPAPQYAPAIGPAEPRRDRSAPAPGPAAPRAEPPGARPAPAPAEGEEGSAGGTAPGAEGFVLAPPAEETDTAELRKARERAPRAEAQGPQDRPASADSRLAGTGDPALEDASSRSGKQEQAGAAAGVASSSSALGGRVGAARESAEQAYRALESRAGSSADEARALREAWRAFARRHPESHLADDARARLVEAGVAAYRLSHDRRDRDVARADAAAYMARTGAHAERVRALLRELEQ